VADEIVVVDYVNHNPVPGETHGLEGLKESVTRQRTAFPDVCFTIIFAERKRKLAAARKRRSLAHSQVDPGAPRRAVKAGSGRLSHARASV